MTSFREGAVLAELADVLDPRRCALLVYDGLRHNVERAGHVVAIAETWPRVVAAARGAGVPVIYTRHRPVSDQSSGAWLRYRMRVAGVRDPALLPELTAPQGAYEIAGAVAPAPEDLLLDKHVNSAFHGTSLEAVLRERGLVTLVVTGIATESGVETTAREALALGFYCVVVADCVSSTDAPRHEASLAAMARLADLVVTSELEAIWGVAT